MGRNARWFGRTGLLVTALVLGAMLLMLTVALAAEAPSAVQTQEGDGLRLVSASEAEVVFRVSLPPDLLDLEPLSIDGQAYVQPRITGWATSGSPGAPELPYVLGAIGAPPGTQVRVEIEPGTAYRFELSAPVAPVATITAGMDWEALGNGELALPRPARDLEMDAAVYGAGGSYPGALAEVVSDAQVRGQRVVGIAAYPVQYEPTTGVLTVYENLEVRVRFEGAGAVGRPGAVVAAESPVFESLFEGGLLNYDQARAWRRGQEPAVPDVAPWTPPEPGYRVYVEKEGFYRLTHGELQAAGVLAGDPDPGTFRMYHQGQEVAIHVELGGDGSFDSGDYLLFYGEAVASKYTRYNVYWLTHGQGSTKAMGDRDGTPAGGTTPATFVDHVHLETDKYYITSLIGDENLDRFVWDYLYPPSKPQWSHTFPLAEPVTAGPYTATLTLAMFGSLKSPITPDHHTKIFVNGTPVEDATWDGTAWRISTPKVKQSLLVSGPNTIAVQAPNDLGVGYDLVYIDEADLVYTSTFTVAGDALSFAYDVTGTLDYVLEGFTTSDIVAFDVTDPTSVKTISGGSTAASGPGYAFTFSDAVLGLKDYRVLAPANYRSVVRIEQDTPSHLQSAANGADYIVVTHPDFAAAVAPLAAHRAAQGLRVVQVEVQDVYDEFGYGMAGAQAIQAFLKYAYSTWKTPAPSYALLVGDGHYDPKNNGGHGLPSYMPPYLAPVDPWITETTADNRYVSFTGGDQVPDMMLGRLAVNSAAETTVVVNKILNYEQNSPPGDWRQEVLLVADNEDLGGKFDKLSDDLIACCLPSPYLPQKVYYKVTHATVGETNTAIRSRISDGKLLVNYIGHASITNWAGEPLFRSTEVPSLTNGEKLPIMLGMTCYEGYHHRPLPPKDDALAEVIVRAAGKGAVASWSPTGLGVATGHDQLNRGFYKAVFQGGSRILGEAVMAGKLQLAASGQSPDLLDTFTLFGDPALQINALDADLQLDKAVEPAGLVEQGQVLTYTLTFSNAGPSMAHGVVLTDVVPAELVGATVVYSSPNVLGQRPGTPFAWEIADLSSGEGGEIQFAGTVPIASLPGPYTIKNEAEITMAEPDSDPSSNTAFTNTPVAGQIYGLYLPLVAKRFDPQLYDDFENPRYDISFNPNLWDRAGHPAYGIRQWAGTLAFEGDTAPANTGAEMYLKQPQQRSLSEVQEFEAELKFDSGQVGGYASVKIQTVAGLGSGQGWWTQCTLAAADSVAPSIVCDVSTYDGTGDAREYRSPVVPTQFDTWYTVRIETDPDTARLSFYVDGVLIGTHLPQDAAALKTAKLSPKVGVWNGAAGTTATRHVDEVRITPAR